MNTLILYATKYGSATACVNALREKLTGEVRIVNIKTDPVPELGEFDQVILGGSIYVGKIQKEMTAFSEQRLDALLMKKVGLFICAGEKKAEYAELQAAFPPRLYDHAVVKDVFGYEIHLEKMNWLERQMMRLKGVKSSSSQLLQDNIDKLAAAMNA